MSLDIKVEPVLQINSWPVFFILTTQIQVHSTSFDLYIILNWYAQNKVHMCK